MAISESIKVTRPVIIRDYLNLTKPLAVLLHLVTTTAAMFVTAKGIPSQNVLTFTLLGGALTAGASNVLNCYFDRNLDAAMARTQGRPLPAGRIYSLSALLFGIVMAFVGITILWRLVSLPVALLSSGALLYYVFIYTLWAKRRTRWGAVIGSGAGAFPPLIGWVAVTGSVSLAPFLLFAIIALWSPPHFWSLAITRHKEYENAGLVAFPVENVDGWLLLFSVLLVFATLGLVIAAEMGMIYTISAAILGAIFMMFVIRLISGNPGSSGRLYYYSMVYLLLLFAAMIVDSLIRI